jgi:hypothetical protein
MVNPRGRIANLSLVLNETEAAMTNAVLLRNVPLVVRDVSSGGCLLESRTPLRIGSVGWLEVEFDGARRVEWFRIARVHTADAHTFLAGAEFLPLSAAGVDSLRGAIGRLNSSALATRSDGVAGRSSGDPGNSERDGAPVPAEGSTEIANSSRKIVDFSRRR